MYSNVYGIQYENISHGDSGRQHCSIRGMGSQGTKKIWSPSSRVRVVAAAMVVAVIEDAFRWSWCQNAKTTVGKNNHTAT